MKKLNLRVATWEATDGEGLCYGTIDRTREGGYRATSARGTRSTFDTVEQALLWLEAETARTRFRPTPGGRR